MATINTSIKRASTALMRLAADTFEEGVNDLLEAKDNISLLFHEDTEEFYEDFDLTRSDSFN